MMKTKMKKALLIFTAAMTISVTGTGAVGVQAATTCRQFVDRNNDGICDNYRTNCGHRSNYVDRNNDGICDNVRYSNRSNRNTTNRNSRNSRNNRSNRNNRNNCSNNYARRGCTGSRQCRR